jgi:hypothetical protein
MSNVALSGNASGTGTFTIASPNSNTDRTLNLPDSSGTLVHTDTSGNLLVGTATNTNSSRIVSNGVIESTTGGVRFPDGSTQTTAAGAVTTTAVLNATAGASAGGVGTYAMLGRGGSFVAGATYSGGGLFFLSGYEASGFFGVSFQNNAAGTWRAMYNASVGSQNFALGLRIA